MRWALFGQALGDLESVHAVHPVEVLGHQSGLVALNGADAMPLQRQVVQGSDFVDRFLDVVFAKGGLPCGMGLAHGIGPPGFGHGQQLHAVGCAPCGLASGLNLRTHAGNVVGNGGGHGLSVPKAAVSPRGQHKAPGARQNTRGLLN